MTVRNQQGLHLRPADLLVKRARQFVAEIAIARGSLRVDGKSILDIATLGAAHGDLITIAASGPDARAAVEAMIELIESLPEEEERRAEEETAK